MKREAAVARTPPKALSTTKIEVFPGHTGTATIWDKDLLIYPRSRLRDSHSADGVLGSVTGSGSANPHQ